jgi:hypothetical protein
MPDEGETVPRTCVVHPEDARRRSPVALPDHVTAKTDTYSVWNLIDLGFHTGVTRGPNLNPNTFIPHHGPQSHL